MTFFFVSQQRTFHSFIGSGECEHSCSGSVTGDTQRTYFASVPAHDMTLHGDS